MAKNIKDDAAVVCGRCITNVDFLFTKLVMNGRSFTLKGVDRLFCYDSACRNLSESTAQTQDWNAHLKLCEGCRVWPSKRVRSRLENYYEDDPFFEGCKSSDVLNNEMDEPEYDNNELERRIERPRPIKLRRIAEERLRAILET